MADNRLHGNDLPLTHKFLGIMLGVRHASVSGALHRLVVAGIIGQRRGIVVILDRRRLVEIANGYSGVAEQEYDRILG